MDVSAFTGDKVELKWNRKDLASLKQVIELVKPHRRIAVQAGGCLGVFPKYLAGVFDTVYTFEPSPESFVHMVHNAQEKNIVRFQAALGARSGMVDPICSLRGNDGKTVLHAGMTRMESGGVIPTIRLDDLDLPACDLLYLDVEGWELYALQGARETIMRHRPVIACEINRGIEYFGISKEDMRTHLRTLDYKFALQARSDEVFVPC